MQSASKKGRKNMSKDKKNKKEKDNNKKKISYLKTKISLSFAQTTETAQSSQEAS